MRKFFKWLFLAFVGFTALGLVIEASKSPEQKAAEAREREARELQQAAQVRQNTIAEQNSLPSYRAADLARAYADNTVAADQMFKNKKYKVSGTVDSINTDLFGQPYLVLRGGVNEFMEPQFSFSSSSAQMLGALRKGHKVTLICMGKGDVAKIPMSGDCQLL